MIDFVSGDILQTETQYLAHGVAIGSQEGLGTGLALKISQKWPEAQKEFKKFTFNHKFSGGDLFVSSVESQEPQIIYIATQPDMYHATVAYLSKGLRNLSKFCESKNIACVSLPKIGAGLGKLDWQSEVRPLLLHHLEKNRTLFNVYEDFRSVYEKS